MFGNSYQYHALPQRDSIASGTGLFVSSGDIERGHYGHAGHSFDYVPRIINNDFTDRSQSCLSRLCHMIVTCLVTLCTLIIFPVSGWFVLKVVPNYERIVFFRLGRIRPPKGPGVVLVLPLIDQWKRVDLRTRAFNIPPCKITTSDGALVSVGADIQFRIWSPVMSVVAVQDLNSSTRLTALNAMTQSLSKKSLREIQTERMKLGDYLGMDINELTKPWGLEVDRVELTLEAVVLGPGGALPHPPPAQSSLPTAPPTGFAVPGLEGLAEPMQQLAMQFLGNMGRMAQSHTENVVTMVNEVEAATAEGCGQMDQVTNVSELLAVVRPALSEELVQEIGASFQFLVTDASGQANSYSIDLSHGVGACGSGSLPDEADVVLTLSEVDLLSMLQGRLGPLGAYASGRLGVAGDIHAAKKLEGLVRAMQEANTNAQK